MTSEELICFLDDYLKLVPSATTEQLSHLGKALGLNNTPVFAKVIKRTSVELRALLKIKKFWLMIMIKQRSLQILSLF